MTGRVPDLLVERLVRGELPADKAQQVRSRLEQEPGGLERIAEIERSNAEILDVLPPSQVAREVRARAAEADFQGRAPSGAWRWVALVVAALALVVVVPQINPETLLTERAKGQASLRVYRATSDGAERLKNDARASAGDTVQLAYVGHGQDHGIILSVDGRGVVTLHFPETAKASTLLEPRGEAALPHAYQLDDAPGHETFVMVSGDEALDVDDVLAAFRDEGLDAEPRDSEGRPLSMSTFSLRKSP